MLRHSYNCCGTLLARFRGGIALCASRHLDSLLPRTEKEVRKFVKEQEKELNFSSLLAAFRAPTQATGPHKPQALRALRPFYLAAARPGRQSVP